VAAPRHTVDELAKVSPGQSLFVPSQVSTMSQMPAELRQTAVLLESLGHAAAEPVQFSAVSQTPAEARHCVPEPTKVLVGQPASDPLQVSCTSQIPADARHTLPLLKVQFALQQTLPAIAVSHCSALPSVPETPSNWPSPQADV